MIDKLFVAPRKIQVPEFNTVFQLRKLFLIALGCYWNIEFKIQLHATRIHIFTYFTQELGPLIQRIIG